MYFAGRLQKFKTFTTRISKTTQEILGRHFWAIGFGCWSTGNITDKMVNDYLEHHRKSKNDNNDFILE